MFALREHDVSCCEFDFWVFLSSCLLLVLWAGITSGLALGLLSFSHVDLEVLIKAGRPNDKRHAGTSSFYGFNYAGLACHNYINSPGDCIFRILPQAVCSRHGLTLGAKMASFVQLLLVVFFPISYPASKLLDWTLGKEHSVLLRRSELKTFVDLHANEAGKGGELSLRETSIITGAMDLTEKAVKDAMTPISETFSLNVDSKLDMHTMTIIMSKGHSRIPIHYGSPRSIVGLILVKNLIFCHPEDETPIKNLIIRKIPRVYENWPLYEILNHFQQGHSHMAVVLKSNTDIERAAAHSGGTPTALNISTNKVSKPPQNTEESKSSFDLEKGHRVSIYEPTLSSSDVEYHSPTMQNGMKLDSGFYQRSRQWEQENRYISQEEIESLSTDLDEEAIGIITMEDVLEELLQGDILDETDEYVHVQRNIRINLLSSHSRISRRGSEASLH